MKDTETPDSPDPDPKSYDFLFLFDKASGSPKVNYFMVDPRRKSHIFPKMNAVTMNAVKGVCSYRVAVLDNHLYILGGKNWETGRHLADINRFDPSTNTWEKLSPMKSARCRFSAEVVNGHIYAIGGETRKGKITDSVECYDPDTNTWSDVTGLPRPRVDHASCSLGGKLYVSGGISSLKKQQSSNVFWVYETDTDCWSELEDGLKLPKEREKHNMVPVTESKIFLVAGRGFDKATFMEKDEGSVCHYNADQQSSNRLPPWDLSHPAIRHTRSYAGTATLGTNIWVFGGTSHAAASHVTKVEVYDTNQRRWRETFSLPAGNFTNVELCRLSIPTHNTSFSFMDRYICNRWVLW